MDLEVDFDAGVVHFEDREVWVRSYPLPIDQQAIQQTARERRRVASTRRSCCAAGAST